MAPRGFCIGLALAAAATSVPVTDAQFLRGVFATSSSSSSYFSSSTWTLGQDGEMHEKVKKMSSEVVETPHGPQRVEKKMVCKDGNCREEMMIQSARNPEAEAMIPPPHFGMGYHARQIMTRLMGRVHSPPPPVIEVVAVPGPAPELKPEIVEMAPPDASRGMALRGMLQQLVGPPTKHGIVEAVPLQPRISNPYVSISHSMARSAAIGCLILASAEGAAPKGPAAPAVATKAKEEDCALNSTRVYLKDLYDQVIAKAENQAIAQYLSTVYARATA
eukprot:CAMPEP_0115680632 /NCGR_PEP_ID=MMETSP0272-20121206/56903_1 /TAXON_ID=71861 /ORGANISM="Scrippsiella trochoidea, Strain CCMP3099" /LENGTH=275 /DNA_ID=CAMNT_0003119911 /DNA_START=30 /DNA_END=857 /DNA_ORIENTATION=+